MTPQQRASALFAFACTEEAPAIVQILIRHWEMNPDIPETEILMRAVRALSKQNAALLEALTRLNAVTSSPPIFVEDSDAANLEIEVPRDPNRYDLSTLDYDPYAPEDEEPFAGE